MRTTIALGCAILMGVAVAGCSQQPTTAEPVRAITNAPPPPLPPDPALGPHGQQQAPEAPARRR